MSKKGKGYCNRRDRNSYEFVSDIFEAGNIAESKIESLLVAEARVTVIAPDALPRVRAWAEAGELRWEQREYCAGDLVGAFLVVAGTATAAVNRAVFAEATAAGILCNAVDDPPFCDYYFPSVVRRGRSDCGRRSTRRCRWIRGSG